jgi:predicted RNA-binding protein with PUA-like domain
MNHWLVKTEPEAYSAHDLEREKRTAWTGVSNPVALKHLRAMADGDEVMVYHTGAERAVVALAVVAGKPRPDPADKSGKAVLVELEFRQWLAKPVDLATIKGEPAFASFDLVRISRLSVMPVSGAHWKRIMALAEEA